MKRYISILLVISMLLSFAACGEKEKKYTVTFETNGGNTIPAVTVLEGQPVSEPSQPTKDGMFFAGWYRDAELSKVYDFSAPVTADLTLYAKWTKYEGSVSADSAPVDTYLISHLTVEGDTVSAAVSAPAGCKLLVRFIDEEIYFSDSYPENKAYLANGDVQAACAVASGTDMETVSAKLSGALPQYYVAEAVLTDDSGAELCSPFSAIDHTARYAAFNSTTIHDFAPEDTVLQFTDSETDNFGVLSGDVITLNAESFVFDEGRGIYEVTGASQTVKAGDKVLLSDGENFALIAVAAVSKGSTLTITAAEDDVSLEDFYQFLKVDQDIVSSAQEDEDVSLSSGPEVLRGQIRKAKKDVSANKIIKLKLDKIDIDFLSYSVDGKVSGDISVKLLLQRDEKRFGKNYFRCEFSYTADMDAKLTVEDKPNAENAWEETELSLGKVAIPFGMMGLNAFAEIRARVAVRTEGGMELQGGFKTTQGFRYSSKDTYQVIDQKRSYWTMSCEGYGEVEFGPMPVVGVEFLGGVLSCELDSFIGVRAEGVVTEPEHTGDTIHACNRCAEGTLYSVCFTDAVMEYDISKSLSGRPIDENIVYSHEYLCDFFVSLNNEANSMFGGKITFGTGLCPNWITNTVATEPAPTEQPTELPTELPTTPPTAPPATEPSENYSEGLEFTLNRNQTGYVVTGIGSCSDTEIIIPPENQGLPVTSISAYAFRNCYRLTRITIPNGVTIIGLYAFEDCTSLTGITIPDSVTSIHVAAFYGCTSLTDITIPSSVTSIGGGAFIGCSSLTGVTIPSSVTSIGDSAFRSCTSLTGITIPSSVTSIGDSAFLGCTSLTGITIPSSVTSIGEYAFYGCDRLTGITIPVSVTSIGAGAFESCTSLTGITIPNSVTSIGGSAFRSCTSLTGVTIPNSVTSIGDSAFEGCTSLTGITIPSSVTSIGNYAFQSCSSLTGITIPSSVTSIGKYAFQSCSSLTGITIPSSVTSIGDSAFRSCTSLGGIWVETSNLVYSSDKFGVLFNKSKTELIVAPDAISGAYSIPSSVTSIGNYAFRNCTSLTGVTIPSSVTSIGDSAFRSCTSLTGITIPSSVTSIGDSAFLGCTSLTGVTIPSSVTSIGDSAFYNCSSLTGITIPNSVTSIGDYAFEYCTSLTGITIPNSVTSIGGEAFNGCTSLTSITIPNSVTSISSRVFESCTSLTGITIPSSVTSIGYSAFEGCTSLTGITIPNSVTSIGDRAFEGCTSLTGVTIPNSVTSIGRFVFYNCRSLTDITYTGSVAQWQAVSKISYWNSSTGAYVIYCTDGQIAKDGTVTYK